MTGFVHYYEKHLIPKKRTPPKLMATTIPETSSCGMKLHNLGVELVKRSTFPLEFAWFCLTNSSTWWCACRCCCSPMTSSPLVLNAVETSVRLLNFLVWLMYHFESQCNGPYGSLGEPRNNWEGEWGGQSKQADGLDHFVWSEVSWCNALYTHTRTTKKYPVVSDFKVFLIYYFAA